MSSRYRMITSACFAAMIFVIMLCSIVYAEEYQYDVMSNEAFLWYDHEYQEEEKKGKVLYFDTPEEAIENHTISEELDYANRITKIVKKIEDEDGAIIAYYSKNADETKCAYVIAKAKKKEIDGRKKYAFYICFPTELEDVAQNPLAIPLTLTQDIKYVLLFGDTSYVSLNINRHKRFIGDFTYSENIRTLRIEGQEPTEVVEFELDGEKEYFWYYENLESTKPMNSMEVSVEEPEVETEPASLWQRFLSWLIKVLFMRSGDVNYDIS